MTGSLQFRWAAAALFASLAAAAANAQEAREEKAAEEKPFVFELWPSALDKMLDKVADDMTGDYEFDEYQHDAAKRALRENITRFLRENSSQINRVVNEFIIARRSKEPPTPEFVAEWSQRALPLLEQGHGMLERLSGDLREMMTDEQIIKLDGYMAAIDVGAQVTSNKLRHWADGNFDPQTEWAGYREVRQANRERGREIEAQMIAAQREATARATLGESSDRPTAARATSQPAGAADKSSTDVWDRYVADFIKKYQLDNQQQQKAHSMLASQKQARDSFLLGKAERMKRVERLFKQAASPDELASAEAEFKKLMMPIERMFETLKSRLDRLPTRKQRADAAQRELASKP